MEVLRAWSAIDCGRAINRFRSGQIEGAFVQGLGLALNENGVDGGRLADPASWTTRL